MKPIFGVANAKETTRSRKDASQGASQNYYGSWKSLLDSFQIESYLMLFWSHDKGKVSGGNRESSSQMKTSWKYTSYFQSY